MNRNFASEAVRRTVRRKAHTKKERQYQIGRVDLELLISYRMETFTKT